VVGGTPTMGKKYKLKRKYKRNLILHPMKLYRGVNSQMFAEILAKGKIRPKGYDFSLMFSFDGSWKFDGSIVFDKTKQNAVLGHQIDSNKFKTSGISTTPHFEIAKTYALHGGKYKTGIVLELETETLNSNDYETIVVADFVKAPTKPTDDENILKRRDDAAIPLELFKLIDISTES
jgi:hypothetical protein